MTELIDFEKWIEQFRNFWEGRFNQLDNVVSTLKNRKKMIKNLAFDMENLDEVQISL